MFIKSIYLENFRSYPKKEFRFGEGVTLIVGPNMAGKSNLLEAVFLLAFGSSPWARRDQEMVGEEAKLGFVRANIVGSDARDLEVVLTDKGKRFRVNGVGRRWADFSPYFHAVLFSPQDLNLVTGNPDLRRRFLDFALSSVDVEYGRAVREYDKVRRRRNKLLETLRLSPRPLDLGGLGFWDAKLLEHGVFIQDRRREFFDEVNAGLSAENLELRYKPSGLTAEKLTEYRTRDIAAGTSLLGPHRDDFSFLATSQSLGNSQQITEKTVNRELLTDNCRDLAAYGSRGEQRRAVLALKKTELDFVHKKTGVRPVLLLDDIFSELDKENRLRVFDLIGDGSPSSAPDRQVIITTTDLHHVQENLRKNLEIVEL
ncbi:MAG: DNA replication/repair protein RecF [Patescibacteria group bacterium]|nr:MAG: DNA replication/repair protein RecF [Patescibacteria group bacterium]